MSVDRPANFTPVNAANNNAIDVTCFAIGFERPFNEKEWINFKSLESSLKAELPSFSTIARFSVTIQQDGMGEAKLLPQHSMESSPQGVVLQKFGADNLIDWMLQVADDKIVINCHDYVSWNNTWQKAKSFLLEVFKLLDWQTTKINFAALQVIDKFVYTDSTKYNLGDIFKENSVSLTPRAGSCGKLWHVHQGWFESMRDYNCLNVLNIGTTEANGGLFSIIDHNQQIILDRTLTSPENILKKEGEDVIIEDLYRLLHINNKAIIEGLLNEKTLSLIKFYGK